MDISAFQLLKNNDRTNANSFLHDTPIISYGRIIKVIDIQTVIAEAVIQTSLSREVYTVTLLNFSSALLEINDYPKLGDTVLLLFLQRHDPWMFVKETINNPNASGYNRFSGVGVLMSNAKNAARTVLSFFEDNGIPVARMNSSAQWHATFSNSAAITFCRAVMDSEDEQLISMVFGQGRPLIQKFLSRVEREHGFWRNSDKELVELDASVTERYSKYAPITKDVQGTQAISVGLGKDKDDNPVETDAPIAETIHGKSPVTRNIRSPVTITVGIGNDETKDTGEQRNANTTIQYGEKADITFESKSSVTVTVKKDLDFISDKPIRVKGTGVDAGGGFLLPFLKGFLKAITRNPTWIVPVAWPRFIPVPPVPVLQNMAITGVFQHLIDVIMAAIEACQKVFK